MSRPGWGGRARRLLRSYWTPAGRRALGNLVGLVFCTAASQVLGFWGLIVLTNGLGPEGYGAVALAATVQWYLIAFGSFGLPSLVIRDLAQRPDDADATVTCYLGVTAAAAAACGAAAAAAVWFVPLNPGERAYLTVVGLCNVAACLNPTALYDAAHRQALAAAVVLPLDVANLLALLALRGGGLLTVENVAALYAARVVLGTAAQWAVYRAAVGGFRWRWDGTRARALLRAGWPSMLTVVVAMVPFHAGVLLARVWRGEHDTGVYGLALAISSAVLAVGMLGVRVVQPHVSGRYGSDRGFALKVAVFGAAFLAGLWAAAAAAAYVLIRHFLDPAYGPALLPTLALLTATALLLAAVFGNCYLIAFHRERLMLWLYAGTSGVYVLAAAAFRGEELSLFAGAATAAMALLAAGVAAAVARSWPAGRPALPQGEP